MRDFKLNKFFDLIIIPLNSLLHLLTNNEISDCFDGCGVGGVWDDLMGLRPEQ